MKKIEEVLSENVGGLHYGNRILLPFRADILKAIVENDIIMDFSGSKKGAEYTINENFTEIYFHDYKNLEEVVTKFETIKLICVEKGDDIFDTAYHRKLVLHIKEKHKLEIEKPSDDILIFE